MSFGMLHCVNWKTVTGVLKDHSRRSSSVHQINQRKRVTSRPRQNLFYELLDPEDLYLIFSRTAIRTSTLSSVTGRRIVQSGVDE